MNFSAMPHAARNEAPAARVALPVVAPAVALADVRSSSDRFRCDPYSCVLTAAACVRRQKLAGASKDDRDAGGKMTSDRIALRTSGSAYRACLNCADGRSIAKAIEQTRSAS